MATSRISSKPCRRALPDSSWRRSRTSSWRSSTRSWKRWRIALRSAYVVLFQRSWTSRARPTAATTSSGVHFGTVPSSSPVKGWSTSTRSRSPPVWTRRASDSIWAASTRVEGIGAGVVASGRGAVAVMCPPSLRISEEDGELPALRQAIHAVLDRAADLVVLGLHVGVVVRLRRVGVDLDRGHERRADLRRERDLRERGGRDAPRQRERDRKDLQAGDLVEPQELREVVALEQHGHGVRAADGRHGHDGDAGPDRHLHEARAPGEGRLVAVLPRAERVDLAPRPEDHVALLGERGGDRVRRRGQDAHGAEEAPDERRAHEGVVGGAVDRAVAAEAAPPLEADGPGVPNEGGTGVDPDQQDGRLGQVDRK